MESAIYVASDQFRLGIGAQLYDALIVAVRSLGMRTIMAGIALPNSASVALLERFGFEKVGHLKEIGRKFDQWADVGYWQLHFASQP